MTPAERSEYNKQYYAANKERLKATRAKKIAMSKEVRLESNKEVEYDFTKLYDLLEARKGTLLPKKKMGGTIFTSIVVASMAIRLHVLEGPMETYMIYRILLTKIQRYIKNFYI